MTKESEGRAFFKMHGLGNDFVIFDGRTDLLDLSVDQARKIARRKNGVGCDQVITLQPSQRAAVYMRIQNADGSTVSACGNATRCVAHLLMQEQNSGTITIETAAGLLTACRDGDQVRVDMGKPRRHWSDIPLAEPMDTDRLDLTLGALSHPVAVNIGNPHVVFFVDDVDEIALDTYGPTIEQHALFPEQVNVSLVTDKGAGRLRHRVWERGAGITAACGSAACAVIVAASRRGLVDRQAEVILDGGILHMQWDDTDHIQMTGPVAYVYTGQLDLAFLDPIP